MHFCIIYTLYNRGSLANGSSLYSHFLTCPQQTPSYEIKKLDYSFVALVCRCRPTRYRLRAAMGGTSHYRPMNTYCTILTAPTGKVRHLGRAYNETQYLFGLNLFADILKYKITSQTWKVK